MNAETIKKITDILQVIGTDTNLKKVAATEGGEYAGPCPFCHGTDRFSVQPNHHNGGRWFCRHCGGDKWHSVIDYVMRRDGIEFVDAMKKLSGNVESINVIAPGKDDNLELNRKKWQIAAYRFFVDSVGYLWKPEGKEARDYLHSRGLNDETLMKWVIGYYPWDGYGNADEWGLPSGEKMKLNRGIVITCFDQDHGVGDIKYIKIRCENGDPKYKMLRGSKQWLFGGFTYASADIAFIFESELDVLLAWQSGLVLGYASKPTSWKLNDDYFMYFQHINDLIVAFDNDNAGEIAADKLSSRNSRFHKAAPLPNGTKDLTEYYQSTGNTNDVFYWLYEQLDLIPRG